MRRFFRKLFPSCARPAVPARRRGSPRLQVESLECRCVPTVAGQLQVVGGLTVPTATLTQPSAALTVSSAWFDANLFDPALRALARTEASDGEFTRADMMALFDQAATEGLLSYSAYSDLNTIIANARLLNMPDDVANLAGKVMGSDLANSNANLRTDSAPGPVYPGHSTQTLTTLEDMWFGGSRHPVASSGNLNLAANDYNYAYASGTLFGGSNHDQVSPAAIVQGNCPDCYLMSALGEVAQKSPQAIKDMFIDNGDNTFTVRFFNGTKADYVTVDRYLPVDSSGKLVFASIGAQASDSSNVLWVALAEKAYAQLNASGWTGHDGSYSYNGMDAQSGTGIALGGWYGDGAVMSEITGHASTSFNPTTPSAVDQIVTDFQAGKMICLDSYNSSNLGGALDGNHSYRVVEAWQDWSNSLVPLDYVLVANPYAKGAAADKPAFVLLTTTEVTAYFYSGSEVDPRGAAASPAQGQLSGGAGGRSLTPAANAPARYEAAPPSPQDLAFIDWAALAEYLAHDHRWGW
jgi:hypothetical protein